MKKYIYLAIVCSLFISISVARAVSVVSPDIALTRALEFNRLETRINAIEQEKNDLISQGAPEIKMSYSDFLKAKQMALDKLTVSSAELKSQWIKLYNSIYQ